MLNLMKISANSGWKIFLFILITSISSNTFTQNITNTLGTGGLFSIKNISTTYFTLTQSTGEINILKTLRLELTTAPTLGVIFKGTDRFIHDYNSAGVMGNNTFL